MQYHVAGKWAFVAVLALAGALTAVSCGVKTPPYPSAATLPDKVVGLSQTITDKGEVILNWQPPKNNMVGRHLKSIGGFEIEMAEYRLDEYYCETCPHEYRGVDLIPALSPPPGLELNPGPYTWRRQMKMNHVYRFRVAGVGTNGGVHPQAWSETVVWSVPAPGALPGFSAGLGDKAVNIGWSRPGAGYQAEIEKRGVDGEWAPLTGLDPKSGAYSDFNVEYEKSYAYRGRLAKLKEGSSIPGPWSRDTIVRVIDVTPPPPPGYLDAALAPGGVQLKWESVSADPDLAGYRVYRRISGENGFTELTRGLLKTNTFFDPITLQPYVYVRYQVTSVDGSPRANESLPSPGADVLLDPYVEAPERPE